MAANNRVELTGFLGNDPCEYQGEYGPFLALSIATTDSYKVEEQGETIWKDRETVWHDVLVFRKTTMQFAKELKRGDRVHITGEISYRPFKTAEGDARRAAVVVAGFLEKLHYEKQERLDYDSALSQVFHSQKG